MNHSYGNWIYVLVTLNINQFPLIGKLSNQHACVEAICNEKNKIGKDNKKGETKVVAVSNETI